MNDSQINIAIAEACGWTAREDIKNFWRAVDPSGNMTHELWMSESNVWSAGIPDYCNDLNAMHEAEKMLTRYQQSVTYSDNLMKIVGYHTFDSAHATAQQRAEAFLRTIGKWNGGNQ